MSGAVGLVWDLLARDQASPAFLKVAAAADRAAGATAKASASMSATTATMGKVGAKLTKSLTLPILGLAAVSVDQAVKWQRSMTLIQTAGGETAAKAAAISKGLMGVAQETGTSLTALSDGIYTVAKAGAQKWSATEQLEIMKAAAEGAKAENVDLGTATNALTSVMMSYHLAASKAVATENMLIRGAGLAKTSMQSYAGSLSTVVPIASAAGIKFDQIAGAIATLTQHGTSADEATQELANTIRNLQKPNNVAAQAMQQLGLSAIDVMKNLGTRGLTGTINLITDAIEKKMGPAGLVAVDAFKKSQSATADLNLEISKMPPKLADLSQQFVAGKIGFKDYRKQIRNLSADQYQMGMNFVTTSGQAMGFNTLLRQGAPAAQTFAGYLNQVMGGANGLNTALQLGGENMTYYQNATKQVGKAALDAGSDVLGWNKTQDTLAVKMDKAKASIQVLAVEIGTALIPAVSKIVDGVSKAVDWFEKLDGTQKKILMWSLGVLAALGPVLSIGAKLVLVGRGFGVFTAGIGTRLASLAGVTEASATRIGTAMKGATAALAGAGIGLALGSLTRNSSNATKAVSTLGSVALGALIGFGAAGPVGAAVGGLTGGLSALATNFLGAGSAAHNAIKPTDDYTQAILRDNDALGDNVRALAASDLSKAGAFDQARLLGIDPKTLTDAILGVGNAKQKVDKILSTFENSPVDVNDKLMPKRILADEKLRATIGNLTKTEQVNLQAAKDITAATSLAGKTETARAAAVKALTKQQDTYTKSLQGLNVQVGINGTSLDAATIAGQSNIAWITKAITSANNLAQSQFNAGDSLQTVTGNLNTNLAALRSQATQVGFNGKAIDDLINKITKTPKQWVTNMVANISKATASADQLQRIIDAIKQNNVPGLTANTAQGRAVIATLQARINALHGVKVPIDANIGPALSKLKALQDALDRIPNRSFGTSINNLYRVTGSASGTNGHGLPEGVSAVGELGAELAIKRGSHVEILSNPQSRAFLAATGMRAPGFANGTSPKPLPAAAPATPSLLGLTVTLDAGSIGTLTGHVTSVTDDRIAHASRSMRRQGVRAGEGGW